MANFIRPLLAGITAVALGVATRSANSDEPAKQTPEAAKKELDKPSNEQPAKEQPEAVKKQGDKPAEAQAASAKKPETASQAAGKKRKDRKAGDKPQNKAAAKGGTMTEALVKKVDLNKNEITVMLRKVEQKVEQTLVVKKDARFQIGGNKGGSLAEVKPETRVALMMSDEKTVGGIKSAGKDGSGKKTQSEGLVKAVDESKNEITITTRKDGGMEDHTFGIAKDVRIQMSGSEGKISDLKPGIRVVFRLSEDKTTLQAIQAVQKGEKRSKTKAAKTAK